MKCIHDKTGKILAWIKDDQNAEQVASNYNQCFIAEIPTIKINKFNTWKYKYDIETNSIIEIE